MDSGLTGARVLVTAASKGLGAATARLFSQEGAVVVINSRNAEILQETASTINQETGNAVFTCAADLTDDAEVERLVRTSVVMLGGLDILVTNAGGPPGGDFDQFDMATWRSASDLTLHSAIHLIQQALPHLRESSRAAILTIVSMAASQPVHNLTLSNTLRPAVVGLTRTLSVELGPENIRVNSILPGITETERVEHLMQLRAENTGTTPGEERAKAAERIPLRRTGVPDEFASAAVFLCSPLASYITGVALPVDGGALQAAL